MSGINTRTGIKQTGRKFVSCNGLGASPAHMMIAYFRSFYKTPPWNHCNDQKNVYTYQCRNAIALICKLLNIGPKEEVLVPAYNCGAEIDPYIRSGAKAILYRINNKLEIDIDDIKRRITPRTRVIHVTHFFGWPQKIESLVELCRNKQIFLIEDCAQALFSKGPDNTIGRKGDAVVYSFVKTLPSPDGGALIIDKKYWKQEIKYKSPEIDKIIRNSLPLFKKWFMNTIKFWQKYQSTRNLFLKSWKKGTENKRSESRPAMLKSNYLVERQINWTISRISKGILSSTDILSVVEKRRRNFLYLHNALRNIPDFTPLFDVLPEAVCPMSFPFMVTRRHQWYAALDAKGILVQGWPGYYPGFNWDDFPEACNLKDNLLTLPVHQYLDISNMEYITQCVKQIAEEA